MAERRRGLGLTQAALADTLAVTPQAASKWACGERLPHVALLGLLADILKVTVDERHRTPWARLRPQRNAPAGGRGHFAHPASR